MKYFIKYSLYFYLFPLVIKLKSLNIIVKINIPLLLFSNDLPPMSPIIIVLIPSFLSPAVFDKATGTALSCKHIALPSDIPKKLKFQITFFFFCK